MTEKQVNLWLKKWDKRRERTMVIIDYANVDHWQKTLGWSVGIEKLGKLVKLLSTGKKFLRRFYYGEDYGKSEKSRVLTSFSKSIHNQANWSSFEIISKRVKYIVDNSYARGFVKKCNLDIEMAVDLIKEQQHYSSVVIFSGDGDLAYVIGYIVRTLGKKVIVFGARDHVGREIIDSHAKGYVEEILFVEDFRSRLNFRHNPT